MEHLNQRCLKALVIDDETEACRHLSNTIIARGRGAIEITGVAHDTLSAERMIRLKAPDVIFIDIEMPGENAIQFLERIHPFSFQVVFVTAYDTYAINAFRMNAVDYLLKPISGEEVAAAIEKLHQNRAKDKVLEDAGFYLSVAHQLKEQSDLKKMRLRSGNQLDIVNISDIYYIEALRSYSKICFRAGNQDKTVIMSRALTEYEEMLPRDLFYRIHKSYLVNCTHVGKVVIAPVPAVILGGKFNLPVSRRRYAALLDFLVDNHFPHRQEQ